MNTDTATIALIITLLVSGIFIICYDIAKLIAWWILDKKKKRKNARKT